MLYIVATPIGHLDDMSKRALDVLNKVDLIAAEDTRHSRKLLSHFAISTPLISLHAHNETQRTQQLLSRLKEGEKIALISDAGTPLVSDPGRHLVQQAHKANITVSPIPGPCAAICALSAAGLPANEFVFVGFLPTRASQREARLNELKKESRTWVCYEAPHRIIKFIEALINALGPEHYVVIARELTKKFETIYGAPLKEIKARLEKYPVEQKGEFVVIVEGVPAKKAHRYQVDPESLRILNILLETLPTKQAAALAAKITGIKKRTLYQQALSEI